MHAFAGSVYIFRHRVEVTHIEVGLAADVERARGDKEGGPLLLVEWIQNFLGRIRSRTHVS